MSIKRDELVRELIVHQGHISYKDMCNVVDEIFAVMTSALQMGDRIEIRGFGSFMVRRRQAGVARNPKTGVAVHTAPRLTVHFRAGKKFRERINNVYKDVV